VVNLAKDDQQYNADYDEDDDGTDNEELVRIVLLLGKALARGVEACGAGAFRKVVHAYTTRKHERLIHGFFSEER